MEMPGWRAFQRLLDSLEAQVLVQMVESPSQDDAWALRNQYHGIRHIRGLVEEMSRRTGDTEHGNTEESTGLAERLREQRWAPDERAAGEPEQRGSGGWTGYRW